jgi:multiple sugar transport system permease protein
LKQTVDDGGMPMQTVSRSSAVPRSRGLLTMQQRRYLVAFLFVLPALINFTVFRYIPILLSFQVSLYNYDLLGGFRGFVGIANFVRALHDPLFIESIGVSIMFAVLKVPLQVILSILLALFVAREVRGMGIIRTVIFIPVVTSLVVASMLWSMIYNYDEGLLQSVLSLVGLPHLALLTSQTLALPAIVAMMLWKELGFSTIIFVAGVKGIPTMFYEAAAIDGAGRLRQFWSITLPLLKPVTLFVVVTQTISSLQVFIPVFVMTQGGPLYATNAVVYYIYDNGFLYSDMGYASAMSFVVLVLIVAVSIFQFRVLQSDVQY